ncbi:TetR/AcrR family transcriptional regulator C-terminal domain-containing protein [Cytobacillus sp. Hz8]|uniref:TetR/AcrR family transcriptional regulator C-terminal domain-containing protein n=1 Tax=Cytobacillus sp. Hz8 TaxID=3347168 RepID=UPI0035DFF5F2
MANAKMTETAIANAMKKLMKVKPFSDISVNDIIKECDVSRKTFYYHFRDKYDVINWIFNTDVVDSILESTTLNNWADGSLKLCRYIYENRTYYTNVVNIVGQNSFIEYLKNLTRLQVEKLSTQACGHLKIDKDDKDFMIEFFYNAFVAVFTTWIKSGMKDTPELIVKRWKAIADKSLENYVKIMAK